MPMTRNHTVNPLLSPPGGLIYFKPIWGGGVLNRDGGLFNLEKRMVSVLHKEPRIQSGEAQEQEGWRSCSRRSESNPNFQLVNKPSGISPHEVLQSWLINTVSHSLVENNRGRGEEGKLNREERGRGSLLTFFPRKGRLIRGRVSSVGRAPVCWGEVTCSNPGRTNTQGL